MAPTVSALVVGGLRRAGRPASPGLPGAVWPISPPVRRARASSGSLAWPPGVAAAPALAGCLDRIVGGVHHRQGRSRGHHAPGRPRRPWIPMRSRGAGGGLARSGGSGDVDRVGAQTKPGDSRDTSRERAHAALGVVWTSAGGNLCAYFREATDYSIREYCLFPAPSSRPFVRSNLPGPERSLKGASP